MGNLNPAFFHREESIYAASTADSSFYESFDPFEYMTAQAQRHEEINSEFQEFQELQLQHQQPHPGAASTPARPRPQREVASSETDSTPTPIRNALIRKVSADMINCAEHEIQFVVQHNRTPSMTEPADFSTIQRRKKQKADYEEVVRKQNKDEGKFVVSSQFADTPDGEVRSTTVQKVGYGC